MEQTTEQLFEKDCKTLELHFLEEIAKAGVSLCPNSVVLIGHSVITIGVVSDKNPENMAFGSEIDLSLNRRTTTMEINFGTTGKFTPENRAAYWRTMHAADLVRCWAAVEQIAFKYANAYNELLATYF